MSDDNAPEVTVMGLNELLRRRAAKQPPAPMSHMAAAMELQAAWKLTQHQRTVHIGELCQERDGLGTMNGVQHGTPMILVRMLDWDIGYDRATIVDAIKHRWAHRYDCLVAMKVPGDGQIHTFPHETWCLEPYTGPRETPEAA